MVMLREFSGINTEDYVNPETDEYVSIPLSDLYEVVPKLRLLPRIKNHCFKKIKEKNLQLDAYYPKVKNKYQITALGLIQVAEMVIDPQLGFKETVNFLEIGRMLIATETDKVKKDYNYKLVTQTKTVSDIVVNYFPDKDPVWLNKQLRKSKWIIHHAGNQWEATATILKKGLAKNAFYQGSQYVRYTNKGVNEIIHKFS